MNSDSNRIAAEIAHVLFMDLVGYSRLSMEEQARLAQDLREVVRNTPEFQRGERLNDLIRLDTGDGMALVFFRDPIAPIQCATEISDSLANRPDMHLRMGIHSGPVSRAPDINGKDNVSGSGINMAQRVMDCGDEGHILLSHRYAEDLMQFDTWAKHLRDLGECEVKHGVRLHLFNFYVEEVGNPATPQKVKTFCHPVPATHAPEIVLPPTAPAEGLGLREKLEPGGGAVPLNSHFYVVRPTDEEFRTAIGRRDSIVLVKGARQMGKTSLLARGLQHARAQGARVVLTDFQTLNNSHLASAETLFLALAEMLADQLDLDVIPQETWNPGRGPNMNLERFLRREVFGVIPEPIVWGLDEVDRLFTCDYGSEVFGLFRSWHNKRALDPNGPWSRLTLAIAYATEAHLFISDLNQSPFNVGTRLALQDFTPEEVAELNRRYEASLHNEDEIRRFHRLLGGQPYLIRRGLDELTVHQMPLSDFEAQADRDDGPFGDHLRRILVTLSQDPELTEAMREVLRGKPCPDVAAFYRLRSTGLLAGESASEARPRCELYKTYLTRHLLNAGQ